MMCVANNRLGWHHTQVLAPHRFLHTRSFASARPRTLQARVRADFRSGLLAWLQPKPRQSPTSSALLQLLKNAPAGTQPNVQQIAALVDELIEQGDGAPFKEELLGGGPWVVRYSRGLPFLWRATWSAGKAVVSSDNRASQDLEPKGRTVENKVEYAGPDTFISASGTYQPLGEANTTPQRVRATITSGSLKAFGRDFGLPISGKGDFEVLFCDGTIRIFRSTGSLAVQVRADRL